MSHTIKIQAQFTLEHISSLQRALENLGWSTKENSTIRTYPYDNAREKVYTMVALNPDPHGYDIGLVLNTLTGEVEPYGDFFNGSIEKTLGRGIVALKQEYTCVVAEDWMAYNGYSHSRTVNAEGKISVVGE